MQRPWTSITLVFLFLFIGVEHSSATPTAPVHQTQHIELAQLKRVIRYRFQLLNFPFRAQYNPHVERYILGYLTNGRRETAKTLGRSFVYFPIFEHYLFDRQLPEQLKYIPFIESRLQPHAKSAVGASGLWQFMPATAKHYDLRTTELLDERLDPHQATAAAVTLLAQLYEDFGDWSLALAAYNCGPGRVRKAIRKTGCHNFWDIKHLLPAQTQRYIPAFLAAVYVANYHHLHGIDPIAPRHLSTENYSLKLHQKLTFGEIASISNLSPVVVQRLNPGYIQQVIPASKAGRYVILPAQAACDLEDYLLGQEVIASIPVSEMLIHDTYSSISRRLDPLLPEPGILPPLPTEV